MNNFFGIGRKKSSTASVFIRKSKNTSFKVNNYNLKKYFESVYYRIDDIYLPLKLLNVENNFDIYVNVKGGGIISQLDAIKTGLSKGLVKMFPDKKSLLRRNGLITTDSRKIEEKKYGRKKSRLSNPSKRR